MQNCMNDDDDDDENESGAAAAFGGDDAPMDPTAAAERRRARQAAYLAGSGHATRRRGRPLAAALLSGSDSDSEAENDALVNGNYGAYSWSRGAGAGGCVATRNAWVPAGNARRRRLRRRRDVAENRPTSTKVFPGPPSWRRCYA